jgi:hypothetical protein
LSEILKSEFINKLIYAGEGIVNNWCINAI